VSRSGIITGMYPISIGSQHMRSRIVPPAFVHCFTEALRAAGYYCTNRSKTDYNFESPVTAWDENNAKSRDWRGRAPGQAFFCVINLTVSHESQIRSDYKKLQHDPAKAIVPPYYPNTEVTRKDWARYYDIVSLMDAQVGEILAQLAADGLAESTIVLFWGDHGRGLTRAKRWLYDSGTHVPLLVRWPGQIPPGSVREDLVSLIDLGPTMLSLAGVPVPQHMQGRVFLGKNSQPEPEFLYGHRDRMDETYDLIRAVRNRQYLYLRNFETRRSYAQHINYMDEMPTIREMRRLFDEGKLKGPELLYFRKEKPPEELYDLARDPHQIHNLADNPEMKSTLVKFRQALESWQERIQDMGMIPEPVLMERMRPDGKQQKTAEPLLKSIRAADGRMKLEMRCATEGASLAYQFAEKAPGARWLLYSQPLTVEPGTVVRARACRLGFVDSEVVSITIPKQ